MNTLHWADRTAVVTGAGAGIGAATARRLHDGGATVVLVDVSSEAKELAAELGGRATAVIGDVADGATWEEVASAVNAIGSVDLFVSNAARQIPAPLTELSTTDWHAQLAVGLDGTFFGLRALLPALQQSTGAVVIVSSVHACVGLPGHPAYAATKGALTALTRQVAVDYAPVRVNCVLPGPILTAAWDGISDADRRRSAEQTVLNRMGRPEEVAAVIDFLGSNAASFVTGATLVVDGGWMITKDSA